MYKLYLVLVRTRAFDVFEQFFLRSSAIRACPRRGASQIVSPRDITEKSYDVMRAYDELYDLHEIMRENT